MNKENKGMVIPTNVTK